MTPVVEKISQLLESFVVRKFELLESFVVRKFDLLLGIEKEIQEFSTKLSASIESLEDAQQNQMDSAATRDWLEKLSEALYDVEDMFEVFHTEAFLWQFNQREQGPSRYFQKLNAAQEIQKASARLNWIEKQRYNLDVIPVVPVGPSDNRCTTYLGIEGVVGREDDRDKLIDILMSEVWNREDDISVLPIIGMGGLGKTTLAKMIFNDDRVKGHWDCRIWVRVSYVFNYSKILQDIVATDGESIDNISFWTVFELESHILRMLKGKSFLLVLDDVWPETFRWTDLRKLFKGKRESRILVTSRNKRVFNLMTTLLPYYLDQLPEKQCWSLFEKLALGKEGVGSERMDKIGRAIIPKCKGLPLAVIAMGTMLRNQDERKRSNILDKEIWEGEEQTLQSQILPVLKLSYSSLPPHLKQCLAYCSMYPKGYLFNKIDLVKVWKASSLILPAARCTRDDIGSDYFDELISRSLFSRIKGRYHSMHDFHHDLAVSVSGSYCYRIEQNEVCNFSSKVRHISLLCDDVERPLMEILEKTNKVRTILSPPNWTAIRRQRKFGSAMEKIFHTLKYIRTLDLSSSDLVELPESVGELKLLHYLDLSRTHITSLPESMCNLVNLETLNLLGCNISELPRNFGRLINLEHLELDNAAWFRIHRLPLGIGNITGLQDLHVFRIWQEAGHGINELRHMVHLRGDLHIKQLENAINAVEANLKDKKALVNITLEWSERDGCPENEAAHESILGDLKPPETLEAIQIFHYQGKQIPCWMREKQFNKLSSVSLWDCKNIKVLSLAAIPHIRELRLRGNLELEEWIDADYPFLHTLRIIKCPKLKIIPQNLIRISFMNVEECDSLKALPLIPSVMKLALINNLVLKEFSGFIEPKTLTIIGCPLITTFTFTAATRLVSLFLYDCSNLLVRDIPQTRSLRWVIISDIPDLTSFRLSPHVPRELEISKWYKLESLSSAPSSVFERLRKLIITDCPNLKSLGPSDLLKNMINLQSLHIEDCPLLQSLPEKGFPRRYVSLTIKGCPILSLYCQKDCGKYWPMIQHLQALRIET